MADVFISYHVSPGTSALVRNIADELESMGISCWYAPRNVTPGAFVPSILDAIACCKAFLMILDEGANGPGYVYNEMLQAFNRFKRERQPEIIPFKLGTFTTIPDIAFYLAPFHMFDGGMSAETAHTEELIHKISALFPKPSAKQSDRETKPTLKSAPTKMQVPPPLPHGPPFGNIIEFGYCGDNVRYSLEDTGFLTIFGSGPMWDFTWSHKTNTRNTPWWKERMTIKKARIQDGVTVIGTGIFDECVSLTSVTIPNSVTEIREEAFIDCIRLKSVTIPESVTKIGERAFARCAILTSVSIPANAKIGWMAFPRNVHITRRE